MITHTSNATVTVWVKREEGTSLHDGMAIEYAVTVANGKPQHYQRAVYVDGDVEKAMSSTKTSQLPTYVKDEVNNHLMPRGTW